MRQEHKTDRSRHATCRQEAHTPETEESKVGKRARKEKAPDIPFRCGCCGHVTPRLQMSLVLFVLSGLWDRDMRDYLLGRMSWFRFEYLLPEIRRKYAARCPMCWERGGWTRVDEEKAKGIHHKKHWRQT